MGDEENDEEEEIFAFKYGADWPSKRNCMRVRIGGCHIDLALEFFFFFFAIVRRTTVRG